MRSGHTENTGIDAKTIKEGISEDPFEGMCSAERGVRIIRGSNVPGDSLMEELDLKTLEQRVDELINAVSRLQTENQSLRAQQAELVAERARLIEKTELARSRVEAMIARLKAMENG